MELSVGKTRLEVGFSFAAVMTVMLMLDSSGGCAVGLAACILHECGHLVCMLIFRERPRRIRLSFYGMCIETSGAAMSAAQEIVTALGGPLINLAAALMLRCASQADGDALKRAALINLAVGLFNLLPCLPLDAGRALFVIFSEGFGELRARKIMNRATLCLLVPLTVVGVIVFLRCNRNFTLLAVSLYITVLLINSKKQLPKGVF